MRKTCLVLLAVLLAISSTSGVVFGMRAAVACALYGWTVIGPARANVEAVLRLSERAHRLYPRNYYLCIRAAEKAYYTSGHATGDVSARRLAAAAFWCDQGLRLNPHKSQLRLLKARLLEADSAAVAAAYWADYVDWHYWEPYNHKVLGEFFAAAGDFDLALRELALVKDSPYAGDVRRAINEGWRRQQEAPPAAPGHAALPPSRPAP